ncbi:MAG: divalent-cation tolerance protein CutA [Metallibacterium scheffleri]|jgi:periplasmic divalent cation tolerance protein|uniref:divalent-cation tolerance protein CutA n=1 Tax=Metallibacterium scheffleri TaxID=993689 RepID=UPI0026EFF6AC|nr:divalent-cation tolerance protein CutA [Metallibacterium scheffleri]MCK9366648.1 divalent-cation tolerance protein CutA [Metallibacterium scheffleri]
MQALLVLSTCPDAASAARIAETLVAERLAACVTRLPGARSVYRWQDAVAQADEVQLLIKTTRAGFAPLRARLCALHPYELPEILAVAVAAGHAPYLDWLAAQVTPPSD